MKNQNKLDFNEDVLNSLRSSGKSRGVEDFPVLQVYLDSAGFHPFIKGYGESPMHYPDLMASLEQFSEHGYNLEKIFQKEEIDYKSNVPLVAYSFMKLAPGYFIEIFSGVKIHEHLTRNSSSSSLAVVSFITLLCPPDKSSLYNSGLEDTVLNIVKTNRLKLNSTVPAVGMICQEDGEFYLKDFYIKTDYKLIEGDLHYGSGFMNFHAQLMSRFSHGSKGLVLFHGTPGTGKTYYIRCLMRELTALDKFVIYLPPNMMDYMVSPEMISYISGLVMDKNVHDNKSCIILIEDAEPLIESRKVNGGRSAGITNLLNMTDGLLNDMLNVQVIATFNTDLRNIDEALLRPERLIARKEFKALTEDDTKKLVSYLKLDKEITGPHTLADIYSKRKDNEVLIHEYEAENPETIGFKTGQIYKKTL